MNKNCWNCKHDNTCDDSDRDNGSSLFGGDCIWFEPKDKKDKT